ncbi:acetolactate decarboxylase [Roseivirga sp. BDSF3-8]|uniref:acetolactate decarboxylase n=1 Tax=Roseivirga sp. BDSF3-8 TaxID=3241598 RepID=UPI0035321272
MGSRLQGLLLFLLQGSYEAGTGLVRLMALLLGLKVVNRINDMMSVKKTGVVLCLAMIGCGPAGGEGDKDMAYGDVQISGAMRNVMWKGELGPAIALDTISDKKGLYGLGPLSYLRGEIMVMDGDAYVSRVTSDTTMTVERGFEASAPFFVHTHMTEWEEVKLPAEVRSMENLEKFIEERRADRKRPFVFRLRGEVSMAKIHVQNLPEGSEVSSPEQAHRGQVNYALNDETVDIVGFFSTEHKGVFTHHDSFVHMHLITNDKGTMGHLDEMMMGEMTLYLPGI